MPSNRNKKAEKAFHADARNAWTRNPWTQVVGNAKAYNRKKEKKKLRQNSREGDDGVSFFPFILATGMKW